MTKVQVRVMLHFSSAAASLVSKQHLEARGFPFGSARPPAAIMLPKAVLRYDITHKLYK